MATYLHFAPAVAMAAAIGTRTVGWRLTLSGMVCAVLPDADLVLVWLRFDIYSGVYGHRGFSHSLGFALLLGLIGSCWPTGTKPSGPRRALVGCYLALCTASHPMLDSLLDVGICSAWLWPLDGARMCLGWRPIPMKGIGLFGWQRLMLELQWIGPALLLLANTGMAVRSGWAVVRRGPRLAGRLRQGLSLSPMPRRAVADAPPRSDSSRVHRRTRQEAMAWFAKEISRGSRTPARDRLALQKAPAPQWL